MYFFFGIQIVSLRFIFANTMERLALYALGIVIMATSMEIAFAMTREQLKKSTKIMKNSCMPKNQVTEEMVGSIEQGNISDDKNVMCYIACIYRMLGVIKNGKLDYESSVKAVDLMYPEDMKTPVKQAIEKCRDIPNNYKDLCEGAYWVAKCMYESNPAYFIFP